MKKLLLSVLVLLTIGVIGAKAQGLAKGSVRCNIGLLYQISYQENWGDSYAIIVEVMPDSPAEKAGLKVGDIIREIDGRRTIKMDEEQITQTILNPSRNSVQFTIARIGTPEMKVNLQKDCLATDVLREEQLAKAFGMYSLEDVTTRRFTMPFIYTLPTKRDFMQYQTFSFAKEMAGKKIARSIAAELSEKGMKEVTTGGDLTIIIKSEMGDNPEYRAGSTANLSSTDLQYRADAQTNQILPYPFLGVNVPTFSGLYRLSIDIEFIDNKDNTKVWSATVRERMNEPYSADRYVQSFGKYIFANYPLVRYVMNPTFVAHKQKFRYLGLGFDASDLQLVREVIPASPAKRAGIVPGDRIMAINGIALNSSSDQLTKMYKAFLRDTWKDRDETTTYTNDEGFSQARFWKVDKYTKVARQIEKPKYGSAFSYLFSHRPYISTTAIDKIVLDIVRNGTPTTLIVTPELKNLDYVELK